MQTAVKVVGPIDGRLQQFAVEFTAENVATLADREFDRESFAERLIIQIGRLVESELGAGLVRPLAPYWL